ncbi:class I SAM-dependent methyltransferase [Chloroflexota bacterium]
MGKISWPVTRFYNSFICHYLANFYDRITGEIKERNISGAILDAGTGPGRLPVKIAGAVPAVTVTGIDISADMIKIARKNAGKAGVSDRVKFMIGSTYCTGFEDASFDLVISTGLVHHLDNPVRAFSEIYRVLNPNGEAWMYDGRRDASREEIRTIIGKLKGIGTIIPSWLVELVWPYMHVGYRTAEYTRGKIARAIAESPFPAHRIAADSGFIKIILKKGGKTAPRS